MGLIRCVRSKILHAFQSHVFVKLLRIMVQCLKDTLRHLVRNEPTIYKKLHRHCTGSQHRIDIQVRKIIPVKQIRLRGATVARLTPDQKVACSNHVGVKMFIFKINPQKHLVILGQLDRDVLISSMKLVMK